jgi:outer membrane cobalamin receptor
MIRRTRLLLILLLLPGMLAAQEPAQELADLQVTATRLPVGTARVPASVTILTGAELRARGLTLLGEALREVPAAMLVQTGSYGAAESLFLRGGESDFTKILVDGVPLNAPGGSLSLADFTLDNVERIEIVRGPASVLYGTDAMSGVVQVFTRDGSGTLHGSLAVQGGDLGTRRLAGRLAAGTGPVRIAVAGSRFSSDGIYRFNNRYLNGTGAARLSWLGGARGEAVLTVRYSDALGHFPTNGSGAPVDRDQRTLNEGIALGLGASRPVAEALTVRFDGWQHRLDSRFRDGPDEPGDSTGFAFAGSREGLLIRRGASVGAAWSAADRLTLTAGAGLERESEDQHSRTASNFGAGRFEEEGTFAAARTTRFGYAQLLGELPAYLSTQVGIRLDHNSVYGGFVTWRAGLVWRPSPGFRGWLAAGTGFKAPTFSELLAATAFEVGNPALDPERSRSAEVGLERRTGGITLQVVGFTQRFEELIQYVAAAPGDPTYANLGAARARGLEGSLRFAVGAATVRLHGAWLETEVTDSGAASSVTFAQGASLLRRPGRSGGLSVDLPLSGFRLAGVATWVGKRDDADFRDFPATRTTLPSYGTVDLAATLPLRTAATGPAVELTARVGNLFDAGYDQAVGFPGRGRTVLLGGQLIF